MIAMDYAFLGNEDDRTVPILTMKDDRSGATMATAVRHKGTGDGWALEYALKFIKFLDQSFSRGQSKDVHVFDQFNSEACDIFTL